MESLSIQEPMMLGRKEQWIALCIGYARYLKMAVVDVICSFHCHENNSTIAIG